MKREGLLAYAEEILRRARRLPVGADRNELRQIAVGLKWMAKRREKIEKDRKVEGLMCDAHSINAADQSA
jgi:hypothetical protein